ncbi:LPXTG cell wall anchor domain-containing protein [Vagococcus sp. BWB3-3]|uniref:LPXTG cell wall anchor domain-containing protein n=1 Tax=Vagococcus allomyrinae TaxID=2794353 RepID=A0A940PFV4_9ENTE|nr:LPXTG cell wall anchor domain-containing protein [Vagococcus allomyrinae]MBP1042786.1 LPXTG cell wall anchor domain-containing protein [Vagococcus allomyrinae]
MMHKKVLRIIQWMIVLASIMTAFSEYQAVGETLPVGVVIGDDTGLYATSEGEYFVDLPSVLPGEQYEKTITIRSLDIENPFELGLLVEPISQTGALDFSEFVTMSLTLNEQLLYQGPLLGDGSFDWRVTPLLIGTCEYGKDQILKVDFMVSKELSVKDYSEESELKYKWTFIGTKRPTTTDVSKEKPTPKDQDGHGLLPKTGEEVKNAMYKALIGLLLILIVLLLWKKRKK